MRALVLLCLLLCVSPAVAAPGRTYSVKDSPGCP